MSEWRKHVKQVYDDMKKKDTKVMLKDALKAASKTWKKKTQKKGGNCGAAAVVEPMNEEVEKTEEVKQEKKEDSEMSGGKKGKKSQKTKKGGKTKKNRKSKKSDDDDEMKPMYL